MNFKEALAKAKRLKADIDNCAEYTDAYVFGSSKDEFTIGGDGPVVIIKKNGRAINMVDYTDNYSGDFIKDIDISTL